MRTLVILHSEAVHGPPEHVFPWLAPLARNGSVDTVVPGRGSAAGLYSAIGRTTAVDFSSLTYLRGFRELGRFPIGLVRDVLTFRREMRRVRPDLVFVGSALLPAALVAARVERIPVVVYVGEIFDKGFLSGRGRALAGAGVVRLTSALANAIVCCSETVARQFEPFRPRLLRTVYPGVDGRYAGGEGARFRSMHGLATADPCLAVVGNVTPGRGQDVAIRALPLLRAEFPAVRLVIAGAPHARPVDRAYATELSSLACRLGVESAVTFVGRVERIADLYAAADIVVNPARFNEPFGRVAVEALSAGRPIVAAHIGAIPEVTRDGREALLFPPGDYAALATAVKRLWRDARLREELVHAGRRRVSAKFSEEFAVQAFNRIVVDVLTADGRKASSGSTSTAVS